MAKIIDGFSAGVAKGIHAETPAKEGQRLTRFELIDALRGAARAEDKDYFFANRGWASSGNEAYLLKYGEGYEADPEALGKAMKGLPEATRNELLSMIDGLVKQDKLTPEAAEFATRMVRGFVGPEYKGWSPK